MQVIITERAGNDIKEIAQYIAIDNKTASASMAKQFEKAFIHLANMPNSGYKKPKWCKKSNIRFWSVKKYLVIYEINKDNITILRLLSSYRDITDLLE